MKAHKNRLLFGLITLFLLSGLYTQTVAAGTGAFDNNFWLYLPVVRKPAPQPTNPTPIPSQGVTIALPGIQVTAMVVDEDRNRVYLADDNSQSIKVLDGATNQIIATIANVGGSVYGLELNQTYGKLYAASSTNCCTDGLTPGTGQIAVINVSNHQIVKTIDPGINIPNSHIIAAGDEVHDKIYINSSEGTGVINAADDTYTLVSGSRWCPFTDNLAINTVLNEVYVPCFAYGDQDLQVIDGDTLQVESLPYPDGAGWPLTAVVNEQENKVYVTMIYVPDQGEMGIYILDRDTGAETFVGKEDLEPLAYNPLTNQVFSGVQIGLQGAVIEGATNQLTYFPLEMSYTGGIGAVDVRRTTNHAYMVSDYGVYVVDGASKSVIRKIESNIPPEGGLLITSVEINQTTGRVYIVFDDKAEQLFVLQD